MRNAREAGLTCALVCNRVDYTQRITMPTSTRFAVAADTLAVLTVNGANQLRSEALAN